MSDDSDIELLFEGMPAQTPVVSTPSPSPVEQGGNQQVGNFEFVSEVTIDKEEFYSSDDETSMAYYNYVDLTGTFIKKDPSESVKIEESVFTDLGEEDPLNVIGLKECIYCQLLVHQNEMSSHVLDHHPEAIQCRACNAYMHSIPELNDHVLQCPNFNTLTPNSTEENKTLDINEEAQRDELEQRDTVISPELMDVPNLRKDRGYLFPCLYCKREMSTRINLLMHIILRHPGGTRCKVCNKYLTVSDPQRDEHVCLSSIFLYNEHEDVFKNIANDKQIESPPENLSQQNNNAEGEVSSSVEETRENDGGHCKHCTRNYPSLKWRMIHCEFEHPFVLQCIPCGLTFSSQSECQSHVGQGKCNTVVKKRYAYNRRSIKHLECLYCSKSYGRSDHLLKHVRNIHPHAKRCDSCKNYLPLCGADSRKCPFCLASASAMVRSINQTFSRRPPCSAINSCTKLPEEVIIVSFN